MLHESLAQGRARHRSQLREESGSPIISILENLHLHFSISILLIQDYYYYLPLLCHGILLLCDTGPTLKD